MIGGISVQILRFADDIVVIAESEEDITLYTQKNECDTLKEYNMKINQRKIKIPIFNKQQLYVNIALNRMLLETIQSFTFHGSLVVKSQILKLWKKSYKYSK